MAHDRAFQGMRSLILAVVIVGFVLVAVVVGVRLILRPLYAVSASDTSEGRAARDCKAKVSAQWGDSTSGTIANTHIGRVRHGYRVTGMVYPAHFWGTSHAYECRVDDSWDVLAEVH